MAKTILSSSGLIAEILKEDPGVSSIAKMIYPIMAPDKAVCPYVVYRMGKLTVRPDKTGGHADTGQIEVMCCGSNIKQMVELSEAVKEALDGIQATSDDGSLKMRSCYLSGLEEGFEFNTFVRTLTFTVKIN